MKCDHDEKCFLWVSPLDDLVRMKHLYDLFTFILRNDV